MYEERKEKFSFKSFFLTLLLVLLFIFLMLWLFPTKSYIDDKLQSTYDLERLSVLYDEIFANNVERMKDAAIGYFTNERMPQTVGQSKKLTLQDMYDLHLILKLKDKEGNPCDTDRSYVEMTKYDEEYRLKVNLSCGVDEDYIIVYLGCYNYCNGGICEKQTSTTPGKVDPTPGKVDPTPSNPTPNKYYCKVVNGKYYDKNGNAVSKSEYEESCGSPTPNKYYCKVVNGKYYDRNGNVVNKTEYEKSCGTPPPEKYYCKVVNNTYYDKNGNAVSKSEYEESCFGTPITKKYIYEYKAEIAGYSYCTAWSAWQKDAITSSSNVQVETKTENMITSYTTVKVQTGTTTTTVVTGTKQEAYIKGYTTELVQTGTKQVDTGVTTTQTITEKVKVGTVEKYAGTGSGTTVPSKTDTKRYEVIGSTTQSTCSNCAEETVYTWKIYNIEPVYDVVTTTKKVPVYKTVAVYTEKTVPLYGYRTVNITKEVTTPVYTTKTIPVYSKITYYRYKRCETIPGAIDIKWSYSKTDIELISKGYKFTGNVKEV